MVLEELVLLWWGLLVDGFTMVERVGRERTLLENYLNPSKGKAQATTT